MKKVAVLLANGFEEIEALATVDILRRAGILVLLVSVESGLLVEGSHNIRVVADILLDELDKSELHALILPGGMPGSSRLKMHHEVVQLTQWAFNSGVWVAAICAAPIVLGEAGILNGKRAVCYPGFEPQLTGAYHLDNGVVVDGKIITSKGAGFSFDFAFELVTQLVGKEKSDTIRQKMLIA